MADEGLIPEDWFAAQVDQADRTDGDIDTLSNRIAHIRTWTFVSNRREWLKDPDLWQGKTREIEDKLSDALHEQLTQRFVDKRTSVLMKSMRDKDSLFAEIEKDGRVVVEKHYVGKLEGFSFTPDAAAAGVMARRRGMRRRKCSSMNSPRAPTGLRRRPIRPSRLRAKVCVWEHQEIGQITAGEDPLKPVFTLYSDEHLAAVDKDNITTRIESWLAHHIEIRLKPIVEISKAEEITGLARGIAFRLRENFGILKRDTVADEIKSVDQEGRAQLRKYGVRFGAHHIYFPLLLKPASADLLLLLWLMKHGSEHNLTTASIADAPRQGLTSVPRNAAVPEAFYRAAGFHVCGPRAVRVDMLERLADIIRPLTAWRPTEASTEPTGRRWRRRLQIRPEMMSIMGCSSEELGLILESLGFRREKRPVRKTAPVAPPSAANGSAEPASEAAAPILEGTAGEPEQVAEVEAAGDVQVEPAVAVTEAGTAGDDEVETAASVTEAGAAGDDRVEPAASVIGDIATSDGHDTSEAAPAGFAEAAQAAVTAEPAEPSDGEKEKTAEPEFEEIWRFRRAKPRFERPEGQGERRHHHRRPQGQDGDRERGPRPNQDRQGTPREGTPAAGQPQSQERPQRDQRDQAAGAREQRDGQRHDRNRQHRPNAGHQRPAQQNSNAPAKAEGTEHRAGGGAPQNRGPQQHHRPDRPHERGAGQGRDNRPPRPQSKQPFTATASPKKSSGTVDPDSPFAALSQLKERMEKQMQTQDEAI